MTSRPVLTQAASAAPRRKLSIRRATIETRAPVAAPSNNLKTRSRSFSDLAEIFGAEAREQHWLHPLQVPGPHSSITLHCTQTLLHVPLHAPGCVHT